MLYYLWYSQVARSVQYHSHIYIFVILQVSKKKTNKIKNGERLMWYIRLSWWTWKDPCTHTTFSFFNFVANIHSFGIIYHLTFSKNVSFVEMAHTTILLWPGEVISMLETPRWYGIALGIWRDGRAANLTRIRELILAMISVNMNTLTNWIVRLQWSSENQFSKWFLYHPGMRITDFHNIRWNCTPGQLHKSYTSSWQPLSGSTDHSAGLVCW